LWLFYKCLVLSHFEQGSCLFFQNRRSTSFPLSHTPFCVFFWLRWLVGPCKCSISSFPILLLHSFPWKLAPDASFFLLFVTRGRVFVPVWQIFFSRLCDACVGGGPFSLLFRPLLLTSSRKRPFSPRFVACLCFA